MVRKSVPKSLVSKTPASAPARKSAAAKAKKPEVQPKAAAKSPKPSADPRAAAKETRSRLMPAAETAAAKTKHKLVRDSFTMPKADFDLIAVLKERALGFRQPAKKSELLRAGLYVLNGLPDESLKSALASLVALKPGRPKTNA